MTDAVNPQTHKKENILNKPFPLRAIFDTDAKTQSLFVFCHNNAYNMLIFFFFLALFFTAGPPQLSSHQHHKEIALY